MSAATVCRLCRTRGLRSAVDLGSQRPAGHFPGPGDARRPAVPLRVLACPACGLAQLSETVPPVQQFCGTYGYRSGLNPTMTQHLADLAGYALRAWRHQTEQPTPGRVLDIGCNDGTLLAQFPTAWHRAGIDPSPWALRVPPDIHVEKGFFPEVRPRGTQYDLIFTVAMFYDLEDPRRAAVAIRNLLAPGGLWVCEVADWARLVRQGIWDGICHEHLTYWSDAAVAVLAAEAGLTIVDITRNECNGGSARYLLRAGPSPMLRPAALSGQTYAQFRARIEQNKTAIRKALAFARREGRRIHLYGASTKANVWLQACDLGPEVIEYAAERSPEKLGHTTATGIPIISEEASRVLEPDLYVVGPWHFHDAIILRERALFAAGTRFLFPMPEVRIECASEVLV